MKILKTMVLAAALSALSAPAWAQSQGANFFKELDADGDGGIDPAEFSMYKGAIFYSLDQNRSLKLEKPETRLNAQKFRDYAGDDGVIDGMELFELPNARFEAFDQDGDRKISKAEFGRQIASLRGGGPQTAETP